MPRNNVPLQAFNRGIISPLALARTDIERVALSAEIQTNWMPRTLGSMMLRPGLGFIGRTKVDNKATFLKFIFSTTDTALIELTGNLMRVWKDDVLLSRPAVSSAVVNGGFDTDLAGWTSADEASASSSWVSGGYMQLLGTGFNSAIRRQQVTVSPTDENKVHALRISVTRGPITLRVGTTAGDDDYVSETSLSTGVHSITLTPAGNFFRKIQAMLVLGATSGQC